ncbi:MAG TPA: hypothetical protein VF620_00840 [Allosphingosinicella sp.]|jgi:hypothetical protein
MRDKTIFFSFVSAATLIGLLSASPSLGQTLTVDSSMTVNHDLTVKGSLILPSTAANRNETCRPGQIGLVAGDPANRGGELLVCQSSGNWQSYSSNSVASAQDDSDRQEIARLREEVGQLRSLVCESRRNRSFCAPR